MLGADKLVKRVEGRGGETSRMQEKGKRTAKIEGLRKVGYEKIGEDERWRGGGR